MESVTEQPPPIHNNSEPVWNMVIRDMQERNRIGTEQYGTPLQCNNGRKALQDAYFECLDQAVYLRQKIEEDRQQEAYVNRMEEHLRSLGVSPEDLGKVPS